MYVCRVKRLQETVEQESPLCCKDFFSFAYRCCCQTLMSILPLLCVCVCVFREEVEWSCRDIDSTLTAVCLITPQRHPAACTKSHTHNVHITFPDGRLGPVRRPKHTGTNTNPGEDNTDAHSGSRGSGGVGTGTSVDDSSVPKKKWNCSACTLENEAHATVCSLCDTRRPKPNAGAGSGAGGAGGGTSGGGSGGAGGGTSGVLVVVLVVVMWRVPMRAEARETLRKPTRALIDLFECISVSCFFLNVCMVFTCSDVA